MADLRVTMRDVCAVCNNARFEEICFIKIKGVKIHPPALEDAAARIFKFCSPRIVNALLRLAANNFLMAAICAILHFENFQENRTQWRMGSTAPYWDDAVADVLKRTLTPDCFADMELA